MLATKKSFIAVESSNGASLNRKITIKDGILFSLLVTEMLAYYKVKMDRLLNNFYTRFPKMYNIEITVPKNQYTESRYNKLLVRNQQFDFKGLQLRKRVYIDGIKFIFDDAWLLIRCSGTNDLIRVYAESTSLKKTRYLIKMGRSFIE
jgi:phosphomannomutase